MTARRRPDPARPNPASANPARQAAERDGRRAEWLAAFYLRCKGWAVLARRVRTPRGEVDLVVRRGRIVAFVEIKWRRSAAGLAEALDQHRLRRVMAAVEILAPRFVRPGDCLRIDAILLAPGRWPRHIANVTA